MPKQNPAFLEKKISPSDGVFQNPKLGVAAAPIDVSALLTTTYVNSKIIKKSIDTSSTYTIIPAVQGQTSSLRSKEMKRVKKDSLYYAIDFVVNSTLFIVTVVLLDALASLLR